jgi:hypothetical protein
VTVLSGFGSDSRWKFHAERAARRRGSSVLSVCSTASFGWYAIEPSSSCSCAEGSRNIRSAWSECVATITWSYLSGGPAVVVTSTCSPPRVIESTGAPSLMRSRNGAVSAST